MKTSFPSSFRVRLMVSFLAVSLIPLLLCSSLLVRIAGLQTNRETSLALEQSAAGIQDVLDNLADSFARAGAALQQSSLLAQSLLGDGEATTQVYSAFFEAAGDLKDACPLHLYDLEGNPRYSSQTLPAPRQLNPRWGVLYAAKNAAGAPVFRVAESEGQTLLQGALLLRHGEADAGYLVMELYPTHFQDLLAGSYGAQGQLLLLSPHWRTVYGSREELARELAPRLRQQLLAGEAPDQGDADYQRFIGRNERTGLYLVLQQPKAFSQSTMKTLYTVSFFCALLCVGICVLLSIPLSRRISSPIRQLRQAFGRLEQDDLSVQLQVPGRDEIAQLAQSFNHMVFALKSNREELVRNQKELNNARLRMLQAQLDPHFLCNTLDTMKWISKINKVPQVALMSTNLADILRYCISDEELVPLRKELEILQRYIEIQRIRLSEKFAYHVEVPAELEDCPVPRMVLQPIVENAIIHGLSGVESSAVRVAASRTEAGLLRLTVTDNGHGLPPSLAGKPYARQNAPEGSHLGLYNVDTILKIHFGSEAGLFLDRGPGGVGTTVTATLPIFEKGGNQPC